MDDPSLMNERQRKNQFRHHFILFLLFHIINTIIIIIIIIVFVEVILEGSRRIKWHFNKTTTIIIKSREDTNDTWIRLERTEARELAFQSGLMLGCLGGVASGSKEVAFQHGVLFTPLFPDKKDVVAVARFDGCQIPHDVVVKGGAKRTIQLVQLNHPLQVRVAGRKLGAVVPQKI